MSHSHIRVGIGGWTYEPWRGLFFPAGLSQKRELDYASRKLTSIEINGTYYGAQSPESFAKWHDETPEDFIFAVKGPRFATNKKVLAEAGASIEKFITGGLLNLKAKLGPINWQFMGHKKFDPADFEAFLKLLPKSHDGRVLRHALEVRHESFSHPDFIALARAYGVAIVVAGESEHVQIADITAPFTYIRAMGSVEAEPNGYADAALDGWARNAKSFVDGIVPNTLKQAAASGQHQGGREVFLYFISGHKAHNPAAAQALLQRLS